ncbi:hypothetical protein OEZ82_25900, partial [Leclercia adecarboxylata]|uniref:hypothetical protein n=1 Tax=Leclercia adecarboxylata TaxID=83655 RepID=UPI00234CFFA2
MSDIDREPQKDALLEAMLPDVVFDGWSKTTLDRAAVQLGIDAGTVDELLPGGAVELARRLDDWADRHMIAALEAEDLAGLRTHQRLILGIRRRLELLTPHREAVRRAIVLNAPPFALARVPQ